MDGASIMAAWLVTKPYLEAFGRGVAGKIGSRLSKSILEWYAQLNLNDREVDQQALREELAAYNQEVDFDLRRETLNALNEIMRDQYDRNDLIRLYADVGMFGATNRPFDEMFRHQTPEEAILAILSWASRNSRLDQAVDSLRERKLRVG